jgi:hypothetical protein
MADCIRRSPGAHRLHHRKTEAEEDTELLESTCVAAWVTLKLRPL